MKQPKQLAIDPAEGLKRGDTVEEVGFLWRVQSVSKESITLRRLTAWEKLKEAAKQLIGKRNKRNGTTNTLVSPRD